MYVHAHMHVFMHVLFLSFMESSAEGKLAIPFAAGPEMSCNRLL